MLESMYATPQPKMIADPIEAVEAIIAAVYECVGHYDPAKEWLYEEAAVAFEKEKEKSARSFRKLQESTRALVWRFRAQQKLRSLEDDDDDELDEYIEYAAAVEESQRTGTQLTVESTHGGGTPSSGAGVLSSARSVVNATTVAPATPPNPGPPSDQVWATLTDKEVEKLAKASGWEHAKTLAQARHDCVLVSNQYLRLKKGTQVVEIVNMNFAKLFVHKFSQSFIAKFCKELTADCSIMWSTTSFGVHFDGSKIEHDTWRGYLQRLLLFKDLRSTSNTCPHDRESCREQLIRAVRKDRRIGDTMRTYVRSLGRNLGAEKIADEADMQLQVCRQEDQQHSAQFGMAIQGARKEDMDPLVDSLNDSNFAALKKAVARRSEAKAGQSGDAKEKGDKGADSGKQQLGSGAASGNRSARFPGKHAPVANATVDNHTPTSMATSTHKKPTTSEAQSTISNNEDRQEGRHAESRGTCYECGQYGHKAFACPNKGQKSRGRQSDGPGPSTQRVRRVEFEGSSGSRPASEANRNWRGARRDGEDADQLVGFVTIDPRGVPGMGEEPKPKQSMEELMAYSRVLTERYYQRCRSVEESKARVALAMQARESPSPRGMLVQLDAQVDPAAGMEVEAGRPHNPSPEPAPAAARLMGEPAEPMVGAEAQVSGAGSGIQPQPQQLELNGGSAATQGQEYCCMGAVKGGQAPSTPGRQRVRAMLRRAMWEAGAHEWDSKSDEATSDDAHDDDTTHSDASDGSEEEGDAAECRLDPAASGSQREPSPQTDEDALEGLLTIAADLFAQPELFKSCRPEEELAYGFRVALQQEEAIDPLGVAAVRAAEKLEEHLAVGDVLDDMLHLVPIVQRCVGIGVSWGVELQRGRQRAEAAAQQAANTPPRGQHPMATWLSTVTTAVCKLREENPRVPRLEADELAQGLLEVEKYQAHLPEADQHYWGEVALALAQAGPGEAHFFTPISAAPLITTATVMATAAPSGAQPEASGIYAKVPMPHSFTVESLETLACGDGGMATATRIAGGVPRGDQRPTGKYPWPPGARLIMPVAQALHVFEDDPAITNLVRAVSGGQVVVPLGGTDSFTPPISNAGVKEPADLGGGSNLGGGSDLGPRSDHLSLPPADFGHLQDIWGGRTVMEDKDGEGDWPIDGPRFATPLDPNPPAAESDPSVSEGVSMGSELVEGDQVESTGSRSGGGSDDSFVMMGALSERMAPAAQTPSAVHYVPATASQVWEPIMTRGARKAAGQARALGKGTSVNEYIVGGSTSHVDPGVRTSKYVRAPRAGTAVAKRHATQDELAQLATVRPTVFHFQNQTPETGVTLERGRVSWCEGGSIMLDCGSNMRMGTEALLDKFDLWEHLHPVDFQVQTSVAGPQAIRGVIDDLQEPLYAVLAKGSPCEMVLEMGTAAAPLYICKSSTVFTLLFDIHMVVETMGYLDPLTGEYIYRPFFRSQGVTDLFHALPGDMYLAAPEGGSCYMGVASVTVMVDAYQADTSPGASDVNMEQSTQDIDSPPDASSVSGMHDGLGATGVQLQQQLPGSQVEHDAAEMHAGLMRAMHTESCTRTGEQRGLGQVQKTEGLLEQILDTTPKEDVPPPHPGTADTPFVVPFAQDRSYGRWEDDDPAYAAAGAGAWTVPAATPPAWQRMPLAYAVVRDALENGRLACMPAEVSEVVEAAEMLSDLVRGKLTWRTWSWLAEWRAQLECQEIQMDVDAYPTFGFPFLLPSTGDLFMIESAREVLEALSAPGSACVHSAQTLLELAEFWIQVAVPMVDGLDSCTALAPHHTGQDSWVRTLLVPLAAAAPLCSFCHPNPFHPLLEWTLADSGLATRNMPLPMRAEGGEAETGVLLAGDTSPKRTRRNRRSARSRLLARQRAAVGGHRRRRKRGSLRRRRGPRHPAAVVPAECKPTGPPARRVGGARRPAMKKEPRWRYKQRAYWSLLQRLLVELVRFCVDPLALLDLEPRGRKYGSIVPPAGFEIGLPWESDESVARPVKPVLLWDVTGSCLGDLGGADLDLDLRSEPFVAVQQLG
jgi:hypothetical protein